MDPIYWGSTSWIHPQLITITGLIAILSLFATFKAVRPGRYPPGPPSLPLVGNILQLPIKSAWLKLTAWKQEYGDLVFLHGFGQHVLVLNSQEAIADLLEQRPNKYSHRPHMIMAGEMMGLGKSMPLLPYGPVWRTHRKMASHALSPSAVLHYQPIQADLAALLCKDFMDKPAEFFDHVRLIAGRIIIIITYGIQVDVADSTYIAHAERTMHAVSKATVPAAYSVEILPWLRHLPKSTPFIQFHKDADAGHQMLMKLVNQPFEFVLGEMEKGTAVPSFTRDMLVKEGENSERDARDGKAKGVKVGDLVIDSGVLEDIRWTSGAMYGAAGESTYSTVLTFIMAMAMNPRIQKLVQQEMDSVLSANGVTFPSFEHRSSLPYLDAAIKETMRWHPALPLSIARRTASDDLYRGFHIPEGTIVIPNVWSIAMEESSKYPPEVFAPERHLGSETKTIDPRTYSFGFGRRVCPGQRLGENSVFIIIASLVACFDFLPPLDSEGHEIPLEPKFGESLVSYPEPFLCQIKLREPSKRTVIEERVLARCNLK